MRTGKPVLRLYLPAGERVGFVVQYDHPIDAVNSAGNQAQQDTYYDVALFHTYILLGMFMQYSIDSIIDITVYQQKALQCSSFCPLFTSFYTDYVLGSGEIAGIVLAHCWQKLIFMDEWGRI